MHSLYLDGQRPARKPIRTNCRSTTLNAGEPLNRVNSTTFTVISKEMAGACPLCAHWSTQVHSQYHRTLQDLPWGGVQIRLRLASRRFRCRCPSCLRQIFTKRFKNLAVPYARRTTRCALILRALCSATSGRGGARLAQQLQLPASPATLYPSTMPVDPHPASCDHSWGR